MSSSEILAFLKLSRPPKKDGRNGKEKKQKVLKYLILLEQEILAGWN